MAWADGDLLNTTNLNNKAGLSTRLINPLDAAYGAVGNGTTDDTAALQAALDALDDAGGGTLWLPRGYTFAVTYQAANDRDDYPAGDISAALIAKNGVTVAGGGTIKVLANATSNYWAWGVFGTLTDVTISDFSVTDITIDGNAANTTDAAKVAIFESFLNLRFAGCTFKDIDLPRLGYSDVATYSTGLKFLGNTLDNVGTLGIFYGQYLAVQGNVSTTAILELVDMQAGCRHFSITGNDILVDGSDAGIEVNAGYWGTIGFNTVKTTSASDGILVNAKAIPPDHGSPTNTGAKNIVITGNTVELGGAGTGISLKANLTDAGVEEIAECIASHNIVTGAAASSLSGIFCSGFRVSVVHNTIRDFLIGIRSDATVEPLHKARISHNTINNCSELGIKLRSAKQLEVNYNNLTECGDGGSTTEFAGIYLWSLDSSAYSRQLIGNQIDTARNGVRISGTIAGSLVIRHNQLTNITDSKWVVPADLFAVDGEQDVVVFGTVAAGDTIEKPVWAAYADSVLTDWTIINGAAIAADGTDFAGFNIKNKGTDGSGTDTIASGSSAGGITAFDEYRPDSTLDTTQRAVGAGGVVSMTKNIGGAGAATQDMICILRYITG